MQLRPMPGYRIKGRTGAVVATRMKTGTGVARGKGRVRGSVRRLKMRSLHRGRAYGATLQNWLATDPD